VTGVSPEDGQPGDCKRQVHEREPECDVAGGEDGHREREGEPEPGLGEGAERGERHERKR
jgi:hypothetical protein